MGENEEEEEKEWAGSWLVEAVPPGRLIDPLGWSAAVSLHGFMVHHHASQACYVTHWR